MTWVSNATKEGLTLNTTYFEEPLTLFENGWNYEIESFPVVPTGDPMELTAKYIQKYTKDRDYINNNYTTMYNTDLATDNLYGQPITLWTDNFEQLVWLCELHPDCAGFSYPPVAFKSAPKSTQVTNGSSLFQFSSGSILFLKKNVAQKLK